MDILRECKVCGYWFHSVTLSLHEDGCKGKEEQDKLLAGLWLNYPNSGNSRKGNNG